MKMEKCKTCGCFLGFDMGQEGDGDYVCNNKNCKSNVDDRQLWYPNHHDLIGSIPNAD